MYTKYADKRYTNIKTDQFQTITSKSDIKSDDFLEKVQIYR